MAHIWKTGSYFFPLLYICLLCDEVLLPWNFRSPGFDISAPRTPQIWQKVLFFLAPPAERQRSFSNADSSVVRRRPSSSVVVRRRPSSSSTFQLKAWFLKNCLITFFLFWHVASLGWYQCIVKIWIWLNHPKGHFERSQRSNLAPFLLGGNFLKNCLITFSLGRSFPRRVLMHCQKMDSIESL